jgi:hypothetical protein
MELMMANRSVGCIRPPRIRVAVSFSNRDYSVLTLRSSVLTARAFRIHGGFRGLLSNLPSA